MYIYKDFLYDMQRRNTLIKTSKLYTGSFKNSNEENYTKYVYV